MVRGKEWLQSAPRCDLARSGARFISWDVTVQKTRSVVLKRARERVDVGGWDCACVDYCESEFLFCPNCP